MSLAPFRAYDADLGRWLSRDPIEERGGLNLYAYVSNNPVNKRDSLGLAEDCDALQIQCVRNCMKYRAPYPIECEEYTREQNRAFRYAYCQSRCLQIYLRCTRRNESEDEHPYTIMDRVLVRVPGSDAQWETVGDVALGVGIGALIIAGGAAVVGAGGAPVLAPALAF